jgi:hypothetical protein
LGPSCIALKNIHDECDLPTVGRTGKIIMDPKNLNPQKLKLCGFDHYSAKASLRAHYSSIPSFQVIGIKTSVFKSYLPSMCY